MSITKKVTGLQYFIKTLFVTQGVLVLAVGIKDLLAYGYIENADLQRTRVVNITWLVVGFATVHLMIGVFTFFYSCTNTIYQPLICFVLWSFCIASLLIHHMKQLHDLEKILTTNLALSLAATTTFVLLVFAELFLHVYLVRLQRVEMSENKDIYELMIITSSGMF